MFILLKMVLIGIDPYPYGTCESLHGHMVISIVCRREVPPIPPIQKKTASGLSWWSTMIIDDPNIPFIPNYKSHFMEIIEQSYLIFIFGVDEIQVGKNLIPAFFRWNIWWHFFRFFHVSTSFRNGNPPIFLIFPSETPPVPAFFFGASVTPSRGLQWSQALQLSATNARNVVQLSAAVSACEKVDGELYEIYHSGIMINDMLMHINSLIISMPPFHNN